MCVCGCVFVCLDRSRVIYVPHSLHMRTHKILFYSMCQIVIVHRAQLESRESLVLWRMGEKGREESQITPNVPTTRCRSRIHIMPVSVFVCV